MSYARARTRAGFLGILGWSLLLILALLLWPQASWLANVPAWSWAGIIAGIHFLISLPFDILGGNVLANRHQQYRLTLNTWWGPWIRASLIQFALYFGLGLWLLMLGKNLGLAGSIGGMALAMILLAGLQIWVARATVKWESFFDNHKGKLVIYLENQDPGFTGGISGIPGMEVFVLPNQWRKEMSDKMLTVMKGRRHGAIQTLAHARGFLAAFLWNLIAFTIAILFTPGGTSSGEGLFQTVVLFSLIQLVPGQAILGWMTRRAVWEIDRWIFYRGGDADVLRQSFRSTIIPEEKPGESSPLAKVFTPVPGPESRAEAIAAQKDVKGAYMAARLTMYLSWAGLQLFSRMLPSVMGRPERWVFLPGD